MSRRSLVLGLAVLLIVSTLAVLGTGGTQAQPAPVPPAPPTAHPAVSSVNLEVTDADDVPYNSTFFSAGPNGAYGDNQLFFAIYDPTGDTQVNFTLIDPNASRDHIASPAFAITVTKNTTSDWYYSWLSGVSYTFPSTITIGGGWTVTASGALGGNASFNITVATFETYASGNPDEGTGVLPGESITLDWQTYTYATGGPDTHLTNVSITGWYYGNGTFQNLFPTGHLTESPTGYGQVTWKVPGNATYDTRIYLAVWASIYVAGAMAENESYYYLEYGVGSVEIVVDQASNYGGICPDYWDGYYDSGQTVQVCAEVGADYGDDFYPVANLPVTITFWNGASVVTAAGSPPTTLTSNATGKIAFTFVATNPPFTDYYIYPYYNTVNLTVSDPWATSNDTVWNATEDSEFYVFPSGAAGGINVELNQLEYYPGQTVNATWTLDSTNSTQTGPLTAVAWYAYNPDAETYLAEGVISSTAATGSFAFTLPTGFVGEFEVEVEAANTTTTFYGEAYGYLTTPRVFLNPSSTTFTPGSTTTLTAVAYGDADSPGAVIAYQVWAEYGLGENEGEQGLVASGTVANNSQFSITAPSTGAPAYYEIDAYLGVPGGSALATTEVELDQSWGYFVSIGVNTPSNYADGSYQPGQTLTIGYQISPYGNAPTPLFYTFSVSLGGTQTTSTVSTTSMSGTFQITIPSDQPSGTIFLELALQGTYLEGNACEDGSCYGETALVINDHPSVLSMEVGGNSGITVAWLILLIVILVVAVILVLLIWRVGRKAPPSSPSAPVTTTPMSTPAPAPSGGPAAEWQEPGPNQPPMPTPPPGST